MQRPTSGRRVRGFFVCPMPTFSLASASEAETVKPVLRDLLHELIVHVDFTVLDGRRTIEEQTKNVARGVSKTMDSKHLTGDAVDIAIYPQLWDDKRKTVLSQWEVDQLFFAGFVCGFARAKGLKLRYGGDWNGDMRELATGFRDLPHFELDDRP